MNKAHGSLSNLRAASALGLLLLGGLLSSHAMADRNDQQGPGNQMQSGPNQGVAPNPVGQVQRGPRRDAEPRSGWQMQRGPGSEATPKSFGQVQRSPRRDAAPVNGGQMPRNQSWGGNSSQHFERVERGRDQYRSPSWQLDMRFHRDHYYPRRGSIVNALPPGYRDFRFRGNHFYFQGGVWFRNYGQNFVISAPPFGLVIPFLPYDYTTLWLGSVPYYYANDVFYTQYPYGPGYAVVEPPVTIDSAVIGPPAGEAAPAAAIYPPPGTAPPSATAIYSPPPSPGAQSAETALRVVDSPPEPAVNANAQPTFVYPAKGQSASRMNKDRKACEKQATGQTGYDPASGMGDTLQRDDYQGAVTTCLEGRGYTVK